MHKIEYEIRLNEMGRPYIELSNNYENKSEDKFLVMELTRYFLQSIQSRRDTMKYDDITLKHLDNAISFIGQISDEMAHIVWNDMKMLGDVDMMINKDYHVIFETLEDLNSDAGTCVAFNDKIYRKEEGLKCLVVETNKIYEYTDDEWKKC